MNLRQLYFRNNACYKAGKTMEVKGIVVHSTGANNPNLKRYIGPDDGLLGNNPNNNHWNILHPDGKNMGDHAFVNNGSGQCTVCGGRQVCVHAWIGKLANGSIATYQTMPWDMRGWHCGGSANDDHVGFEICEAALDDKAYFALVYREAVEFCAYLCNMFKLDPLAKGVLICHDEGFKLGVASNHSDVLHWFPRHGKNMDVFRNDVKALMAGNATAKQSTAAPEQPQSSAPTTSGNNTLTNIGLIEHAKKALAEDWGYVLGEFGRILTPAILQQKCTQGNGVGEYNTKHKNYINKFMGKRVTDCYGLIKSYVWWNNGDIKYNGSQDRNQEGAYNSATEKGTLATLPEMPGLCLWMKGHAGVYIGNGELIECIGAPKGMNKAKIVNGKVVGGSNFTHWFKDNYITYNNNTVCVKSTEPISRYPISEKNMKAIVDLGIINSPDYWAKVDSVQWLNELMEKVVSPGFCDKRINNGITDWKVAINTLVDAGIINSPEYWHGVVEAKAVQYIDGLVINMANRCRIILEKIVHAESQGEGLEGQEYVANVILNRVKDSQFPNAIYPVVFAGGKNTAGVMVYQFSPIGDGAYAKAKPSDSVKVAISNVLNGKDKSQGALYFCTKASAAKGNWHETALKFLFEHKNHRFYK